METMTNNTTMLDYDKLDHASNLLRAIAHPIRLSIISFIHKHQRVNVNKIYNTLKLEQSITSQHLKILRKNNLVQTKREGKFIFYNLDYKKINQVITNLNDFLNKRSS
jgi:DNA-binding transcriptional ArsR family regulator